jgi:hypothetical protein
MSLDAARLAIHAERERLRAELGKLDAALEALGEVPPVPQPAKVRRKPGPKPKREHAAPKERAGHAPPGESRDLVLPHLPRDWVRVADIMKASGLSAIRARVGLVALRREGLAENNGKTSRGSRWRAAKAKRSKTETEPAQEHEPAPVIHRDVKPANIVQPPSPVVDLGRRTVKVEGITSRDDRFRCLPLSCVLTAGACVDRQAKANGTSDEKANYAAGHGEKQATAFRMCKSCSLGRKVVAQLGSVAP